jgi:hypothetical protein
MACGGCVGCGGRRRQPAGSAPGTPAVLPVSVPTPALAIAPAPATVPRPGQCSWCWPLGAIAMLVILSLTDG